MDLERRVFQVKEVVRVSATLRADMPPEAICALVAQTIHTTLGFHAAVVNLIMPPSRHFVIVATAGITDAERQRLINEPPPIDHIVSLMRRDFQLSRSYFIGHEHKYLLEGAGSIALMMPSSQSGHRAPNAWHPDDVFFVPLYSTRENRLLGIISLDLPDDGKIPTYETVEVIELLAIHAANALDTARLFQERNQERQALDYSLAELLAHVERMRQRDFSTRAQLRSTALTQVAAALNDMSATLGNVLADVRDAGVVVQRQANEMRNTATELVHGAQRQAEQIRSASEAIQQTSEEMHQIVRQAAASSAIASQAENISSEGRDAATRAGEGMNAVREITLQAAKRIKRLGESSQEISQVIQLVSEFASQTHLLALNAAIEAANAGEHGSGFAIVAREIRNLAQNSNEATKQIQARITSIQNETNQVAVTIEYTTQQVVELSELVTRAASSLHAIDTVIQQITGVISAVHQTAEEQAGAAATVSDTMRSIAGITGLTWESAEEMRTSMDRLAELASVLRTKIETFRLGEGLQPTGAPSPAPVSQPLTRNTNTPAASFPAVSFPAVSQPPAPSQTSSPAASFPARPFTNASAGDDMALEATMPMSAIQTPYIAPMPPMSPMPPAQPSPQRGPASTPLDPFGTSPRLTVGPAPFGASGAYPTDRPSQDGESAQTGAVPAPAPLFPGSDGPLTPIRLSALDDNTALETGSQPAVIIHTGDTLADEPHVPQEGSDLPMPADQAAEEPAEAAATVPVDGTAGDMNATNARITARLPAIDAIETASVSTPVDEPSEAIPPALDAVPGPSSEASEASEPAPAVGSGDDPDDSTSDTDAADDAGTADVTDVAATDDTGEESTS